MHENRQAARPGRNCGGGRHGLVYDGASVASCSCGYWSCPCESRDDARRKARGHREQATAAALAPASARRACWAVARHMTNAGPVNPPGVAAAPG